ncbi:hypothetical protein Tco_1562465 [Tanacetum coccineum]
MWMWVKGKKEDREGEVGQRSYLWVATEGKKGDGKGGEAERRKQGEARRGGGDRKGQGRWRGELFPLSERVEGNEKELFLTRRRREAERRKTRMGQRIAGDFFLLGEVVGGNLSIIIVRKGEDREKLLRGGEGEAERVKEKRRETRSGKGEGIGNVSVVVWYEKSFTCDSGGICLVEDGRMGRGGMGAVWKGCS